MCNVLCTPPRKNGHEIRILFIAITQSSTTKRSSEKANVIRTISGKSFSWRENRHPWNSLHLQITKPKRTRKLVFQPSFREGNLPSRTKDWRCLCRATAAGRAEIAVETCRRRDGCFEQGKNKSIVGSHRTGRSNENNPGCDSVVFCDMKSYSWSYDIVPIYCCENKCIHDVNLCIGIMKLLLEMGIPWNSTEPVSWNGILHPQSWTSQKDPLPLPSFLQG